MGLTPKTGLLFLSGAVIAGLGAAYILGAFDGRQPAPVAITSPQDDQKEPAGPRVAGGKEGRETVSSQEDPTRNDEPAEETVDRQPAEARQTEPGPVPNEEANAETIDPPSFDIVRVEPDGSMVIAGRSAPNARVEIVNGATVIGMATSGPSGDFAAVLDNPLEPGDYQIVLRATTPDNLVATSLETAIVTVPDSETGQVLALVDQPGEPSRLITVPEAQTPSSPAAEESAEATPATEAPDGTASEETLQAEVSVPAQAQAVEPEPDTSPAEKETHDVERTEPSVSDQRETDETEANATETATESEPATENGGELFIEAVEIDGGEIFVAGAASPGRVVRVYANNTLLGETIATPNGRFLVEARRELPVGDYIVRADMLSEDGRSVMARAAVPFTRSSGEKLSAVTTPEAPKTPDAQQENSSVEEVDIASGGDAASADLVDGEEARVSEAAPGEAEPGSDDAMAESDTVAPRLSPVEGSVIIRRGDTLWHISRRVYGRGIRYTTLYLANQDQIEDPDRIWPGQVFTVPESSDQGEPADMEAIQDQVVTPETSE